MRLPGPAIASSEIEFEIGVLAAELNTKRRTSQVGMQQHSGGVNHGL